MERARGLAVFMVALVSLAPRLCRAQDPPLASLLPRLLSEAVTMPSSVGNVAGNPHEAHFLPSVSQLEAPYALNAALVAQLSTFPLGSSSGGFTYDTQTKSGIPKRTSSNFGPAFVERALTAGKGRFTAGFNIVPTRYDHFEGLSLKDGSLNFFMQHNDCCPGQNASTGSPGGDMTLLNPFFEGDLVGTRLSLDVKTDTAALFMSYGISNRIDVGIAIPIVRVQLDATMDSDIVRLSTASNTAIHSFGSPSPNTRTARESGSASGLGDIVLRAKYRMLAAPGGGIALGVDLRLPTGDKDQLLGTGATQARFLLIYSADFWNGKLSPHYNISYTFSRGSLSSALGTYALGDETPPASAPLYDNVFRNGVPEAAVTDLDVPNEINIGAGIVVGITPRFTLTADVLGRTLLNVQRFGRRTLIYQYREGATGPFKEAPFDSVDITIIGGRLSQYLGVAGFKFNVAGNLLLVGNVLFPLWHKDEGLRSKVTPVFGLDYAF